MEETNSPNNESSQSQAPSNNANTVINQEALPNSTLILVLGISSIAISVCCCVVLGAFGFIGILIGGIAAVVGLIILIKLKRLTNKTQEFILNHLIITLMLVEFVQLLA